MKIKRRVICDDVPLLEGIHPILSQIYAARGVRCQTDLEKDLKHLPAFDSLKGIQAAVVGIAKALQDNAHIMIIGDFDADGATSTALAVSALKAMGATNVSFLVPNRFLYGYGLTPELVDFAARSQPDLLITVDNGITSVSGVEKARALGIDVIITDHHLPGDELPQAAAIVNPNQHGDVFPSKCLAGVGVIFYVMLALRRHLQDSGFFEKHHIQVPNMAQFLDLVALGTVADVVPLDHLNRILVEQGLKRMRYGQTRPGILELIAISGKSYDALKSSDLGFSIGPRLNAAGRLDDMRIGILCLLSEDRNQAKELAYQLDSLNEERRHIEQTMRFEALEALQSLSGKLKQRHLPVGLCLLDNQWHQGVIGILAGRLKEIYHRPVFIFARVSDSELKGSGRSVQGVNIRDILAEIDTYHPGLMNKFGGHAMAAGVSLDPRHFSLFQAAFEKTLSKYLSIDACQGELLVDGKLDTQDLSLSFAQLIADSGPWGQQFPEPLFEGEFDIVEQRLVGKKHLKLILRPIQNSKLLDAIAFNINPDEWPNQRVRRLRIVYALDINIYQSIARLQLIVHHFEPVLLHAELL